MPDIQIGAAIDAVDELLRRGGQPPKIGAGTSQPPPVNNAPSRFGASALTAPAAQPALPQTPTVGAPGGTAPFMPSKIGASPQPAMPSSPKIGAGMDTYDPSQSPMPGGGQPDYAAQYAAVHDPTPVDPNAGKPSTLRKIGGIALGAGIGAFNPQAGAQIGSSIVNGPRNELMRDYNQQEGLANQQRERIKTEAGLADTGSQMEQRQAQAVKDRAEAANIGNPKPVPAEVGHTYVDDKGNEVAVMKDGSTKVLGPAQQKQEKPDTANQDKQRYESITADRSMGKTIKPEDSAWAKAYEKASTLGPAVTAAAAGERQQQSFTQQEKMFQKREEALTSATKTMIETAPTVIKLADRVEPMIDKLSNELGPSSGRWSEFWAGKVGSNNPEYTKLRTDVGLLRTSLMRMHVGARGSKDMMEYFKNLIDQGKQDPENLKAALVEIRQYANDLTEKGKAGGMNPAVLSGGSSNAPTAASAPQGNWNPKTGRYE